jgi:phosphate transport system substrate-binding protein
MLNGKLGSLAGALLLLSLSVSQVSAEGLRGGGTGATAGLISRLAAALAKTGAGSPVELVPGLGSSGAIAAVIDGAIDFAITGRPLKAEERARNLVEFTLASTPFVLVSSHPAPAALSRSEVGRLFAADHPTWPDGAPVRFVLRPKGDSDSTLLAKLFPGMDDALAKLRVRPEVPVAQTDQDNLTLAEQIAGSLAVATFTQLVTEQRKLHMIAIDGVAPSLAGLEDGSYPFVKEFHFVYARGREQALVPLLAFLSSSEGRLMLSEAGMRPQGP